MEQIWGNKHCSDEEDDDEEALSLSDLPLLERKGQEDDDLPAMKPQIQEEFDFCSASKESEMCAADEVFFQGQILPLHRHSISSYPTRPISRSESVDRLYSGGLLISSRSSSTSSSSASISKFRPRLNQFHSHPSPSPRIRFPGNKQPGHHRSLPKNSSSIWNIFRLGLLVSPPVQDLRTRCPSNIRGSRNSTCSSNGSSIASINSSSKRKAKALLAAAGGCRCSSDAVVTVPSRVVTIKRSASEGEDHEYRRRRRQMELERTVGKKKQGTGGKKQLSHHRTFEWIKQLSLEAAPESHE